MPRLMRGAWLAALLAPVAAWGQGIGPAGGGTIGGGIPCFVTGCAFTGAISAPSLTVTGNAAVNGGTLSFAPAAANAVIDPGTKNLLLKAGAGGNTGLVQSFAPFQAVTLNMAPDGVVSNTSQATIRSNAAYSGSQTNGAETAFHFIGSSSDTVSNTAGGVSALVVAHNFGGALANGPRNTVDIASNFTAASGSTAPAGIGFTAMRVTANMLASDGGTAPTPRGVLFAGNFVAHAVPAATFSKGLVGSEFDVWGEAGSNFQAVFGVAITQVSGHQVQGSRDDAALSLNNQSSTIGWKVGIGIGAAQGAPPISTTGTVMAAIGNVGTPTDGGTVAGVFDFSLMTATAFFLKGPGSTFVVDGAGIVTAAAYKVGATAGVTCASVTAASVTVANGLVTHC